jgi:hypothetical protein
VRGKHLNASVCTPGHASARRIYLNEHRDCGGARTLTVTIQGQKRADGRAYPPPGTR